MRVVFSEAAKADLQSIAVEIAKDNPERALTCVDELILAGEGLSQHPTRHALQPKFGKGVRRLNSGEYGIFYRVLVDKVQISRVLHGRRRIRRAMML